MKLRKVLMVVIVAVTLVLGGFIVASCTKNSDNAYPASIAILSSFDKQVYPEAVGQLTATVKNNKGEINYSETNGFTFESDNENILYFINADDKSKTTSTNPCTFYIAEDAAQGDEVTVTVRYGSLQNTINLQVKDKVIHQITFEYPNSGNDDSVVNVYEGFNIEQSGGTENMPDLTSAFQGWNYEWVIDGSDEIYDPQKPYIWNDNITVKARISTSLFLKDSLDDKEQLAGVVFYGQKLELELPELPDKQGWQFEGWYTNLSDEPDESFIPGVKIESKNTYDSLSNTLYAKWSAKIPVALLLESNITQQEPIEVIYNGKIVGLPEPNYKVKYPDGTFKGFALSLNPDTDQDIIKLEKINDGQGIEQFLINESTIYTYKTVQNAMFFACIEFELTVDYQCADNINGGKNSYSVIFNRPINESIGGFSRPEKINWEFNGYYQQPYAKGMQFTDETAYVISNNTTIYASWKQDISLKANINNIEDVNLTLIYGEPIDLTYYTYGKQGSWKFDGWYTKEFGVGQDLNKITRIELGKEGDQNQKEQQYIEILNKDDSGALYAKWVANEIVLYKNGGTVVNGIDTNLKEIIYGVSLGGQGKALPSLEREGYTFDKWLLSNGEEFNTMAPITILQLPSLSACWVGKNVTVHLTSEGSGEVEITATMGEDMPVASIPPSPDSRNFNGYYYQASGSDEKKYYYTADMESKRPWDIWSEEPVTLKADWITGLAVEWEFGNGTDSLIKVVNSYTRASDIAPQEPTKTQDAQYSYTFVGWNTNPLATVGLVLEDQYITESTKFYAIYSKKLRTYTVNWYNSTGSLLESDSNVEYGSHPDFNSSNPTKSQDNAYIYTFSGWNIDKDASSTLNIQDYTIVGDVDFYPIFNSSKRKYTITVSTTSAKVYLNDVEYDDGNTIDVEWDTNIKFSHKDIENTCDGWWIRKDDGTNEDISVTNGSFVMPQSNVKVWAKSHKKNCIVQGTLITLADGRRVTVESLKGDEMLLVWNIYTGEFDAAPILFIDSDPIAKYEVINLYFSDGTKVGVIDEHGFWDYSLNKWVFLRDDAENYIGHWFKKQSVDENGKPINNKVQLIKVVITEEVTKAWSPVTFGHLCLYVNGMLSMPGATEGFINIFDVEPDTVKVNEEHMAADIAKYGLFTYDDFAEYIPEEMFYAFNGQYLKVSMGKGLISWEDIFSLIDRYKEFWQF